MSSTHPVRVVQCPKCGSPVQGASAGIIVCTFCGASLQVYEGASGHRMARLAHIETSTLYLAKAEALKQMRAELAQAEETLRSITSGDVGPQAARVVHKPSFWNSGMWDSDEYEKASEKAARNSPRVVELQAECERLRSEIDAAEAGLRVLGRRLS